MGYLQGLLIHIAAFIFDFLKNASMRWHYAQYGGAVKKLYHLMR